MNLKRLVVVLGLILGLLVSSGIAFSRLLAFRVVWLKVTRYCPGCDLRYANLLGVNLQGANLVQANLSDSVLSEANMTRAVLIGAICHRTDFSLANLSQADLTQTDLSYANLSGVSLRHAQLHSTNFNYASLLFADLEAGDLQNVHFYQTELFGSHGERRVENERSKVREINGAEISGQSNVQVFERSH